MNTTDVRLRDGSKATLYQADSGIWLCPICGSEELKSQPYFEDVGASFEMCSCGFEYGFDDDPGACAEALEVVQANWLRWRTGYLKKLKRSPLAYAETIKRLEIIGVSIDS